MIGDGRMADIEAQNRRLREVADRQHGYFTAKQAQACGIPAKAHSSYCLYHGWIRIGKGLYRLGGYANSNASRWLRWLLWSRDGNETIQGALCRQSALAFYGLRPDPARTVHMAVPVNLRKRGIEDGVQIYPELTDETPVLSYGLFRAVSPSAAVRELQELLQAEGSWPEISRRVLAWEAWAEENGTREERGLASLPEPTLTALGDGIPEDRIREAHLTNTRPDPVEPPRWRPDFILAATIATPANVPAVAAVPDVRAAQGSVPASEPRAGRAAGTNSAAAGRKNMQQEENPMAHHRWNKTRKYLHSPAGFTLVELLVVIAIVTILAGLLMPALSKAVEQSKSISCLAKTKQIGTYISLYTDDYAGYFPPAWVVGWANANLWTHRLSFYYNTPKELFYCPTDKLRPSDWKRGTDSTGRMVSYGYNMMGLGMQQILYINPFTNTNCPVEGFCAKASQIRNPSKTIAIVDSGRDDSSDSTYGGYSRGDGYFAAIPQASLWGPFLPWPRHHTMTNTLFTDGHSSSYFTLLLTKQDRTGSPSAINNFDLWSPVH